MNFITACKSGGEAEAAADSQGPFSYLETKDSEISDAIN